MIKWLKRLLCLAFVGAIALTGCDIQSRPAPFCGKIVSTWHECSYKCETIIYKAAIVDQSGTPRIVEISEVSYGTKKQGDQVCVSY